MISYQRCSKLIKPVYIKLLPHCQAVSFCPWIAESFRQKIVFVNTLCGIVAGMKAVRHSLALKNPDVGWEKRVQGFPEFFHRHCHICYKVCTLPCCVDTGIGTPCPCNLDRMAMKFLKSLLHASLDCVILILNLPAAVCSSIVCYSKLYIHSFGASGAGESCSAGVSACCVMFFDVTVISTVSGENPTMFIPLGTAGLSGRM